MKANPNENITLSCSGSIPKVATMTAGWEKDGGNVDPQMVIVTVSQFNMIECNHSALLLSGVHV